MPCPFWNHTLGNLHEVELDVLAALCRGNAIGELTIDVFTDLERRKMFEMISDFCSTSDSWPSGPLLVGLVKMDASIPNLYRPGLIRCAEDVSRRSDRPNIGAHFEFFSRALRSRRQLESISEILDRAKSHIVDGATIADLEPILRLRGLAEEFVEECRMTAAGCF